MLPAPCNGYCQFQPSLIISRIEDPSIEPTYLDEELTRVRVQIHQLLQLQAGLLCHHNQRYSPICALPPELLATIFLLTCMSGRNSWEIFDIPTCQVVVLSSVSSYWRQVALQTPSLWNTVTLAVDRDTSETKAALLQHHLIHAKNLSVSLDLILDGCDKTVSHGQQYQTIASVLFAPENAQKVTTLRVDNLPPEWPAKLPQLLQIHTLVLKNLRGEDNAPVTLNFHNQPLQRISISFGDRQGSINLPWSVQELLASNVTPRVMFELLRQCPNLTRVASSEGFFGMWNTHATPLTLSRLETLNWSAEAQSLASVQNLSLPVLKHLHLEDGERESTIAVINLCHRLSGTLKSLELEWFECWEIWEFRWLFLHEMEHLETLKLTQWPLEGLVMVVQVLTPSDEELCRNEVKPLPSLQSLVLEADLFAYDIDATDYDSHDCLIETFRLLPPHSNDRAGDMIDLFLEFLEKRGAGQITPFHLNLPVLWTSDREMVWSERLRDKFRQAIKGRRIEVLQGGQVLDWLS